MRASSLYCPRAILAAVAGLHLQEALVVTDRRALCEVCSGLGRVLIGCGEILTGRD